jgi:hypothetical protein
VSTQCLTNRDAIPKLTASLRVTVFDYISPLASTDDISMEDMMTGNTERMQLLLERLRTNFPGSSAE